MRIGRTTLITPLNASNASLPTSSSAPDAFSTVLPAKRLKMLIFPLLFFKIT